MLTSDPTRRTITNLCGRTVFVTERNVTTAIPHTQAYTLNTTAGRLAEAVAPALVTVRSPARRHRDHDPFVSRAPRGPNRYQR